MIRRRMIYGLTAAIGVVAVLVAVIAYSAVAGEASMTTAAPADRVALASKGQPGSARHGRRTPGLPDGKVDIARVEAALARMQATTARFSQEQLADEQKRMAVAKARFEAIKPSPPKTRPFTDENGIRWVELQYESGELRYELAPEPEPNPTRTADK